MVALTEYTIFITVKKHRHDQKISANMFVFNENYYKCDDVSKYLCLYDITLWMRLFFFFVTASRRKLKADLLAAFPLLSAGELSELVPNKDDLNVVKIYAHKGEAVTVYVLQKNPIFFELEKRLFPTGNKPIFGNWLF